MSRLILYFCGVRFFTVPRFADWLFPELRWRMPSGSRRLYLTFDDGPTELTPWILETLKAYGAKATFFCVGQNVEHNPEKIAAIRAESHLIGGHTEHHLKGWHTPVVPYMEDVNICEARLGGKLFRPPYGQLKLRQMRALRNAGYKVFMWSYLTYDFDRNLSAERAWQHLESSVRDGHIIVFHDNLKAEANVKYLLPRTLEYFSQRGYSFHSIA